MYGFSDQSNIILWARLRALLRAPSRYAARMTEVYEHALGYVSKPRRYTPGTPWTTTRSVPRRRGPGRDPLLRAPRRCGADPAERVLRRRRVRARNRAADEDPGTRRRGQAARPGRAADRGRSAAVHRRDAARRHARQPRDRCPRRASAGACILPAVAHGVGRLDRVPEHHLSARGHRRARSEGGGAALFGADRTRRFGAGTGVFRDR